MSDHDIQAVVHRNADPVTLPHPEVGQDRAGRHGLERDLFVGPALTRIRKTPDTLCARGLFFDEPGNPRKRSVRFDRHLYFPPSGEPVPIALELSSGVCGGLPPKRKRTEKKTGEHIGTKQGAPQRRPGRNARPSSSGYNKDPTKEQMDVTLSGKAVKLGAKAVVNVKYDSGVGFTTWGNGSDLTDVVHVFYVGAPQAAQKNVA